MNEELEKKPYHNYLWLVFVIVVLFAFILINTLTQGANNFFVGQDNVIFTISSLIGGFVLFTIIYNIGKVIFASFSGFKLIAINLLFITISKINNKWNISLAFPEGLGGNVHVIPNKNYDSCKPILFHLGGTIFSVLIATLTCVIIHFLDNTKKIEYIALIVSLFGIIVLIVNMIPVYTDGISDGFAIKLLLDKNNKKAYLDNLYQYDALVLGNRKLQYFEYDTYKDIFQAYSLIYRYYYFMDREEFYNAEKTCELMIASKGFISSEDYLLAQTNKLYFVLLSKNDNECYDYYYSLDKEIRSFAISTSNYETLKVGILVAGKVEKTFDLYEHLLRNENKTKKIYYQSRLESEEKLVSHANEIVLNEFPDWKD